ncbi:MAG: lipid-binding SYLF domain-containing protein [Spirochaetaceae bacterium]|nr:MAG: lipid-binding SYLF domain-containing protein [Spirochaetaceae bacterium]
MKSALFIGVLVCLLIPAALLVAQAAEIGRVAEAELAFRDIMSIPDKTVPEYLLQDAEGLAIIPSVVKVGFIVGGEYGKGVLLLKDVKGAWSNPIFITLSGGSIGWQLGAQSADFVLVFKTKRSVDGILGGNLTLGVDVAAAAGPLGRRARASTDTQLKAEIYSYSRSRGFFAGLSLDGALIQIDDEANAAFYKVDYISPRDIQSRKDLKLPTEAVQLKRTISDNTKSLGR